MSEQNFDALRNIEKLFKQKTLLDVAIEVEKFLDFLNIWVFLNWFDGEIVDGPNVGRYWITLTLKYDYKKMPDPMGARILHDVGVKVNYIKDIEMDPIKIQGPEDFRPNSKKPKLEPKKIWFVELKIPRRFIDDVDYNDLEDIDDDVDADTVKDAADDGLDVDDVTKTDQQDTENSDELPAPMPPENTGVQQ